MPYDFETLVSRRDTGSSKWNLMYKSANTNDLPEEVIPFSIADMDLKHAPEITAGLQHYVETNILGYTHPYDSFLKAVCGWMEKRHNWHIEPEWIVTYPGIVPALYSFVRTYTNPGEGVIVMPPVYYPFYSAIRTQGRTVVENQLVDTGSQYEIDFDDLEQKAKDPKNTMLIFCSPHNPVGRVWTPEELDRVGRICLENNVLIISDEIHFDLILPGYHHTVFSTISPAYAENMIVCTAPSKTFNLAGMILSNIIIQNDELRRRFNEDSANQGNFEVNALGYKACEIAYTQCEPWLEELIAHVDKNRRFCEDFIKTNMPAIKVRELQGTYLQWWDCRELAMADADLENLMQKGAQLYLDEGYIFGSGGSGYERINLACPTALLEKALQRLKKALEA